MGIDAVLAEWRSKKRRMGCVSASEWWIKRLPGFRVVRKRFYYPNGEFWEHVVITDGVIEIDPSPYANHGSV